MRFLTSKQNAMICLLACLGLSACGSARWQEKAGRFTGDPVAESQTTNTRARDLQTGDRGYVNPDRVKGVEIADQDPSDSGVTLDHGTEVVVMDPTPHGDDEMVKVRVKPSPEDDEKTVYLPPRFISRTPVSKKADRYFVVENIATERLRVYERCSSSPTCPHKLVFETEMLAGEDTPDKSRRSIVGSFVIDSWTKFYENRKYPSWLIPNGPKLPGPGADLASWTSLDLLPAGSDTQETRAAFGWFTAKIRPNAKDQWTHGTWGHGSDGDRLIRAVKASGDLRVQSHGCTRVENRAIALMHEILPAGTKLVKIYAREAVKREVTPPSPRQAWSWVLTDEGAGQAGSLMTAGKVSEAGKNVLDRGVYSPSQTPRAYRGNVYGIRDSEFRGTFLVDEGRLENYEHPRSIERGGYSDRNAIPQILFRAAKRLQQ